MHSMLLWFQLDNNLSKCSFFMCHIKAQGPQVKENEVLYLQLYEETTQDCEHFLHYLKLV